MPHDLASLHADPGFQKQLWVLYQDWFHRAERNRRWNLRDDIPWEECNPDIAPEIADVVQTFCMVELFLPDYLSKLMPQVRTQRGRSWMVASWGYEESKHSMALSDWLVRSGKRREGEMDEIADKLFAAEWPITYECGRTMVCYTMAQELATQLHYRNLRHILSGQCKALDRVLQLVMVDEAAHHDFFRKIVQLYMVYDRPAVLEDIRQVLGTFQMPTFHLFADSRQRASAIRDLNIFDESMYYADVVAPILQRLGITRAELRRKKPRESVAV